MTYLIKHSYSEQQERIRNRVMEDIKRQLDKIKNDSERNIYMHILYNLDNRFYEKIIYDQQIYLKEDKKSILEVSATNTLYYKNLIIHEGTKPYKKIKPNIHNCHFVQNQIRKIRAYEGKIENTLFLNNYIELNAHYLEIKNTKFKGNTLQKFTIGESDLENIIIENSRIYTLKIRKSRIKGSIIKYPRKLYTEVSIITSHIENTNVIPYYEK